MNFLARPWQWWKQAVDNWAAQHEQLPKPWRLYRSSWGEYRRNWRLFMGLTLIVALPSALISTYLVDPSSDTAITSYLNFAQLAMNCALIFAIVRLNKGDQIKIREAYYRSSAMLVRLILVTLLLILLMLPLILGLLIFLYGVVAPGTTLAAAEKILLILLAVVVAIPGIALAVRAMFSVYAIFESWQGPLEAIKISRKLSRGRVLITLGRIVVLALLVILTAIVPSVILVGLASLTRFPLFTVLLQILFTATLLPIVNLYLYRYYQGLKV